MFDEEGYSSCSLDNKGVKKSDAYKRMRHISDRYMKGTTYAILGESKFYYRLHDVFTILFCLVSCQIRGI